MPRTVEQLHRSDELAREAGERDAQELRAAMETETSATEKEKVRGVSEINVFTLDPNGFKTHWKITSDTTDAQLAELMKREITLTGWLKEKNYKPDEMGRGNGHAPAPVQNAPQAATSPATAAVWVVNQDGSRSCSLHGVAKYMPPGVSRSTGKPYTGFWACQVKDCKPAGEN